LGGAIGPQRVYPDDVYLVLMTPVVAGLQGDTEARAKETLDTVAGLTAALLSPNMLFLPLFEHAECVRKTESFVPSLSIRRPDAFRAPDLSMLRVLEAAAGAIAESPESLRNRVALSARWLQDGLAEFGVDAFIKLWVAIEVLTMTSEKTGPLIDLLATAYGETKTWVRDKLKIDRLANKRGNILHGGKRPAIPGDLLRFLAAIYEDALAARLGLPFPRRAEAFIGSRALQFL
jgi:hypothetical protein